ncbi:MAG: DUF1003 domain-containing protein [Chloroflexi bacterium]|nr:DUF1003 domain-containing protein [Chloroflexota bacterium]
MSDKSNVSRLARFKENLSKLSPNERRIVEYFEEGRHISRNPLDPEAEKPTFGQRLSDRIASFGGSWRFIILFFSFILLWVILNTLVLSQRGTEFDPFPFILLNLLLSLLASIQAPVILMSQTRQESRDRLNAQHDYEVNLKAELEIMSLHEKMDHLQVQKWDELIAFQQQQLLLLEQIASALNAKQAKS